MHLQLTVVVVWLYRSCAVSSTGVCPSESVYTPFYQVATRVPTVFKVPFPKGAQRVLSIFEVFNINIAGLSLPLSCMGLGTFWDQLLFTILFPIGIAVCICLCAVAYASLSQTRGRSGGISGDRSSPLRVGGLLALPHLLTLSFLVLPMVSSAAFQAFSCEDFDEGSDLFSRHHEPSMAANLAYMAKTHGFFIPHMDYVTDLPGLLAYLLEMVYVGNVALVSGKQFHSLEAVQAP